jgi:3-methyladenine DNA glycosylase Tag
MRSFDQIFDIAAARKGGPKTLDALLTRPISENALAQIPEDRWLSQLTKGVFRAGFSWKVIDAKWSGFEDAFKGFDVSACAMMNDDWFDQLITNPAVVRNGTKIASVRDNAVFLSELRNDGGAGVVIGRWPASDFIGVLELLKKRGSRLGGTTAQYALRSLGKDSFVLSTDVTARLVAEGIIDRPATSKRAMTAVQTAFNEWSEQSGRSLTEISQVLAMSV